MTKYPDRHLYDLAKKGKTITHYSLAEGHTNPLLSNQIKLSSGTKNSPVEWFWLHQREPDRWGFPVCSLKPLFPSCSMYFGHIQYKDKKSLVLLSTIPNSNQVLIEVYRGFTLEKIEDLLKIDLTCFAQMWVEEELNISLEV